MFHNPYLIIYVKEELLDFYEKEAQYKLNDPKDRGVSRFLNAKSNDPCKIHYLISFSFSKNFIKVWSNLLKINY